MKIAMSRSCRKGKLKIKTTFLKIASRHAESQLWANSRLFPWFLKKLPQKSDNTKYQLHSNN